MKMTVSWISVLIILMFSSFCVVNASIKSERERVLRDTSQCYELCNNTYKNDTHEKDSLKSICEDGCRYFSIVDCLQKDHLVSTEEICLLSCTSQYSEPQPNQYREPEPDQYLMPEPNQYLIPGSNQACNNGCNYQYALAQKKYATVTELKANALVLQPLLYIQGMLTTVRDSVTRHLTTAWTYYRRADNGDIVVVQSPPRTLAELRIPDGSNFMETTLRLAGNPAMDVNIVQIGPVTGEIVITQYDDTDMMDRIFKRTDLSRVALCLILFLSGMTLICICLRTATDALEHKVESEKLSIHCDDDEGDEPLILVDDKLILTLDEKPLVHQNGQQAAPLPIKVKIETV